MYQVVRTLILCVFFITQLDIFAQRVPEMSNWVARTIVCDSLVSTYGLDSCFVACAIDDKTFSRMKGKSWRSNCTLNRTDLRYVRVLHRNGKGENQMGELVVHKSVSEDVVYIFRKLYEANYRIELMVLIDEFEADDEKSMNANNTSCFNFRFVTGSHSQVSYHGKGRAIDLNPLYNPYVKGTKVAPAKGKAYAYNRNKTIPYLIDRNDLAYKLFRERGWRWGGAYNSIKDYQHFEK